MLNPKGEPTIDFADPAAVKALNFALLKHFYGISKWDIPPGYLCPPIPGRADYLHVLADLLGSSHGGKIPRGDLVRVLDIGVGANCIYPIIGRAEYGWSFVGSEIDATALESAKKIVRENACLADAVELRLQGNRTRIFEGVVREGDFFDLSLCNPPFHASLAEAQEGSARKWRQLGVKKKVKWKGSQALDEDRLSDRDSGGRKGAGHLPRSNLGGHKGAAPPLPKLNFGGQDTELWCPGGEARFARLMIQESARYARNVSWFSTLISKEAAMPGVLAALKKAGALQTHTLAMSQGQKKSRAVAWTFFDERARRESAERLARESKS